MDAINWLEPTRRSMFQLNIIPVDHGAGLLVLWEKAAWRCSKAEMSGPQFICSLSLYLAFRPSPRAMTWPFKEDALRAVD